MQANNNALVLDWDFSSTPVTTIAGQVEFRLFGYGSDNLNSGVFGPDSFNSPLTVNSQSGGVHLEGTIGVIPEPSTAALVFGSIALVGVLLRSRRKTGNHSDWIHEKPIG